MLEGLRRTGGPGGGFGLGAATVQSPCVCVCAGSVFVRSGSCGGRCLSPMISAVARLRRRGGREPGWKAAFGPPLNARIVR